MVGTSFALQENSSFTDAREAIEHGFLTISMRHKQPDGFSGELLIPLLFFLEAVVCVHWADAHTCHGTLLSETT